MPPGPTTTALVSAPNPSFTGTSVLFTATVTDGFTGNPVSLGTVTFKEGATVLASNVPLSGGVFTFSTSALTEGSHLITAEYSGDTGLYFASSGSVTHVVNNQTVVTGNQYCNPGAITIPSSGSGTPYPSNIFVSGLINPITKLTLSLAGFSHQYPPDLDLLLVGPSGQKFVFMGTAGGILPVTNLALTFDDAALSLVPVGAVNFLSGTYRPTNTFATAGNFPAPAPASPYQRPAPIGTATFGSVFNAATANGTWKLYVWDVVSGQSGSINGGWCLGITTQKSDTTVSLSTSPNPSLPGQQYTASATLNVVPPGTGTPTGTIEFRDQTATLLCTATLPTTSCNHTFFTSGSRAITATYSGDANFNGSTSAPPYNHTINSANTSLTITNAAFIASTPSYIGQQLTVNWNVSVTPPATTGPGFAGTVQVSTLGGSATCSADVSVGTCLLSPFTTAGPTVITATYLGTPSYQLSSNSVAHTVLKNPTVTNITNASTLSSTPSVVGQAYAVDVSVTQAVPLPDFASSAVSVPVGPTGTVQVSDGAGGSCTITLPSSSCNIVSPTTGLKTITAVYNGDSMFEGSPSGNASHTVNKADTSLTSLTDSPDPSVVGQPYTVGFTLNVTPPGSSSPTAPTGTVSVSDGAGGSCTATLPATSCQITSVTQGNKTVTVTYNGDTNFNISSNTAGHAVNKADTTVAITNDTPDPSVIGQNYAVTASVSVSSPGSGTPTGSITVTDGTNNCTITLPSTSCNLPSTSVGAKTLTATYSGDGNYNGSGPSAGVAHQVNKADVVATITSDNPDPSALGQNVTVAFSVAAAPPGAGTPTGSVTITITGGSETCTGSLAAGSGSCTLALTVAGSRTLTATYNGDTNFNTGTDTEPHTVVAPPVITKTFTPASVPVNGISQITIQVSNPAVNTVNIQGAAFTDAFPPGMVVANPVGLVTSNCGGSQVSDLTNTSIAPGDIGFKASNITAASASPCTIQINVTPTVAGTYFNATTNVTSTNGGTGNAATATLTTNIPPTISSNTVSVKAGSAATSFNIGTAADPDQAANTLGITINGNPTTASSNGVQVSAVAIGAGGAVTANIATTCAATSATFNLVVTDSQGATGNGTLTVTVIPNTAPVLTYANQVVTAGTTPLFVPASGPNDNGTFTIGSVSVSPNNGGLGVLLNQSNGRVTILNALLIGSYVVTVPVTDNCGAVNPATLAITVVCPTITLSPASLPNATINTAYPQTISASPAGGNYSFSVTSGLLPSGMTLNGNGSFSGAPTQSGTFNFRVTATGFGGCTGYRDYSLTVLCPTITLSPSSLPNGTVGTGYNQSVAASPAGSYNYAVTSGSLPVGLSLNTATGAITGTPTVLGSYNFVITATAGGCSGSNSYSMTIQCAAVVLSPTSLPNGEAGVAYSQALSVNPAGTYTFSLIQGSLPAGITLNSATGLLSGLVAVQGTYTFTVKAQNSAGCSGTQSYTLQIVCPTILVNPSVALPGGSRGTFYSQTFTASPAGGGYVFSVTLGALPPGLNLNSSGVMSGTPTTIGTFNFRIAANGFGGCSNFRDYTLVISGATCPTVTLGDIPATATVGAAYVSAIATTPAAAYTYEVTSGSVPPGITLYGSFGLLFGYPTSAGPNNFTVKATDTSGCTGSREYSIVVGLSSFTSLQAGAPMVVSAASYRPDSATPGGIMAAFGESLAADSQAASTIPLPTEIAGTRVLIRDSAGVEIAAPLLFVSPKQINFVIPEEAALGEATMTFVSSGGVTRTESTVIHQVAPGLFGANDDGSGAAAGYFLRVKSDGTQLEEPAAVVNAASGVKVPAAVAFGDETEELYLVLSGTGLRGRTGLHEVIARVGGAEVDVTYAGAQNSFVGLDQMNIRIPRTLAGRGGVEVEVLIDGRPANIVRVQLQ
jgi:uncharacterized protein (TIGR03437 family)